MAVIQKPDPLYVTIGMENPDLPKINQGFTPKATPLSKPKYNDNSGLIDFLLKDGLQIPKPAE